MLSSLLLLLDDEEEAIDPIEMSNFTLVNVEAIDAGNQ